MGTNLKNKGKSDPAGTRDGSGGDTERHSSTATVTSEGKDVSVTDAVSLNRSADSSSTACPQRKGLQRWTASHPRSPADSITKNASTSIGQNKFHTPPSGSPTMITLPQFTDSKEQLWTTVGEGSNVDLPPTPMLSTETMNEQAPSRSSLRDVHRIKKVGSPHTGMDVATPCMSSAKVNERSKGINRGSVADALALGNPNPRSGATARARGREGSPTFGQRAGSERESRESFHLPVLPNVANGYPGSCGASSPLTCELLGCVETTPLGRSMSHSRGRCSPLLMGGRSPMSQKNIPGGTEFQHADENEMRPPQSKRDDWELPKQLLPQRSVDGLADRKPHGS